MSAHPMGEFVCRIDLQLSNRGIWERDIFTGRGPQLKLAVHQSKSFIEMAIVLSFGVLEPINKTDRKVEKFTLMESDAL